MSNAIPYLFEAKQVSMMAFTPQVVASNGTVSDGTTFDLADLGVFDRLTFSGNKNLFEYSPANAQVENYQKGKLSFSANVSQFDAPGKASVLLDVYGVTDYVRIAARGTNPFSNANGKILVFIAAIESVETGFVEGKNATSLVLRPCGLVPQWALTPTL